MDKNTIIGIILIFLIFIGFSVFNSSRLNKSYEKIVARADSLYEKGEMENARAEYMNALRYKATGPEAVARINELNGLLGFTAGPQASDSLKTDSPVTAEAKRTAPEPDSSRFGAFGAAVHGDSGLITLENENLELKISPRGGKITYARLKEYKTYDSLPLVLFSGDSTVFGFKFYTADNKAVETSDLFFVPASEERSLDASSQQQSVILRLMAGEGRYIEYRYTLEPGKYVVDFNVSFIGMEDIVAQNLNSLTFDWRMYMPQQEKGRQNEDAYTTIKYKYYQDDVDWFRLRSQKETESLDITTKLSWVAFQGQFFSSVLISNEFFLNGLLSSTKTPASEKYLRHSTAELGIPFNASSPTPVNLKLYYGPNQISTLRKEGLELEKLVSVGKNLTGWINRFLIIPVFNFLEKYIASYGLIILLLTIVIKIILLPLTLKSYQSQAKMQVLKPLVDELGKKFPKKEDAMKKQQATMDLYKRAGVNPMGGCLPMLLQMPILFAMFKFFPVSIELRQEAFLWANDLSTYDSILTLPFKIPIYGNHVSLWTLLMTLSTILATKMSGSSAGQDQPGMKMMMYMMPVMFMLMLNNFSSGLTYYYFLANILTLLQNLITKRFIDEKKLLATLEENRKKPLKKSKWQMRLEEAAKQRGIQPSKK